MKTSEEEGMRKCEEEEDEVEKALSRPCLYTSEEKLDTGLSTRVVSGIRAVVRGTDTRYVSRKPLYVGQSRCTLAECRLSVRETLRRRYGDVASVRDR